MDKCESCVFYSYDEDYDDYICVPHPGFHMQKKRERDHFSRYSSAMRLMADTPELMTFSSKTILPLCSDT